MAPCLARIATMLLVCLHVLSGRIVGAAAQEVVTPTKAPPVQLRVSLDCQYECDTEYLRQNIEFINYVRDRAVWMFTYNHCMEVQVKQLFDFGSDVPETGRRNAQTFAI